MTISFRARSPAGDDDHTSGGALEGMRILDLTSVIMGPYATQVLADHGADVIFVEQLSGTGTRELGALNYAELSGISLNLLRNKRSLCVDLKTAAGRGALLEVAAKCHAVVTNLRPGPLRRLGLTYEDFAAVQPEIIFCQAVGFAGDTDRADDPAYDDIVQAECGLAACHQHVTGSPQLCPTILADKVCGLVIANSLLVALLHRGQTGRGQRIEVPMVDVMRGFMMVEHGAAGIADPDAGDAGYMRILNAERGPQRTKDGWIMILPYGAAAYDAIFGAGGREDLVGDPRTRGRGPMIHAEFLYAQLRPIIAERKTADWLDFCREHRIPVGTVDELNQVVRSYPVAQHPQFGPYRLVPPAVRFWGTPAEIRRPAPMLGEHTEELLYEAGMTESQVQALEEAHAIRRRPVTGRTASG